MSAENDIEILQIKHRKEKKELQAQIQALKKTAKNDKSKKKELTTNISKLETDLESRQNDELMEALKLCDTAPIDSATNIETQIINEDLKSKVSKAQRRRDKQFEKEKAREEEIKLQEKENINGPRNLENSAISSKLKKRHLKLFLIPSDGDCLYKAIEHQLEQIRNLKCAVSELRQTAALYISENKHDFLPFMNNPETFDMLSDLEFEDYCQKIKYTKVWGGQLEIKALSNSLKCPIKVIQASGPDSIDQGEEFDGPPLIITYHRHMYRLGEHFNSTVPDVEDNLEQ